MAEFTGDVGFFIVVSPAGWAYPQTLRVRARDTRKAMGEILVGMKFDGVKVETVEQGWKRALQQGYRVHKVDVVPHVIPWA